MELPKQSQVTIAPRCTKCGSGNTITRRSQRIPDGLVHDGARCAAQKQYRECRSCGASFPAIKIGAPIQRNPSGRSNRPT